MPANKSSSASEHTASQMQQEMRDDALSLTATIADTSLDAAIKSGALDGLPIIGLLTGIYKAQRSTRELLYFNKVVKFLQSLKCISQKDRDKFLNNLESRGEYRNFGEQVLLLIGRLDDVRKPALVGRIMGACIRGELDYTDAMRLSSMVDRCYFDDLSFLQSFEGGTGGAAGKPIAESLYAAGFLSDGGFDGGSAGSSIDDENFGGTIFVINRFGRMLIEKALR